MNSVVRQLHEHGTDVVIVDTGNSYEGLCEYLGGKYISYTEEKPITMNPFNITKAELNIEKIDFLKNLILLIWKGSDSKISELEFRIIEQIVTDYYDAYFHGFKGYDPLQRETLRKTLTAAEKRKVRGVWRKWRHSVRRLMRKSSCWRNGEKLWRWLRCRSIPSMNTLVNGWSLSA